MGSKYIKKAPVEKTHWQRRFINAHEEILSKYAIDGYKSKGRGTLLVDCSQLMEYIVPGFNIPYIDYYEDEGVKELFSGLDRGFVERYNNYDPEKTYYIIFDVTIRIWNYGNSKSEIILDEQFEIKTPLHQTSYRIDCTGKGFGSGEFLQTRKPKQVICSSNFGIGINMLSPF